MTVDCAAAKTGGISADNRVVDVYCAGPIIVYSAAPPVCPVVLNSASAENGSWFARCVDSTSVEGGGVSGNDTVNECTTTLIAIEAAAGTGGLVGGATACDAGGDSDTVKDGGFVGSVGGDNMATVVGAAGMIERGLGLQALKIIAEQVATENGFIKFYVACVRVRGRYTCISAFDRHARDELECCVGIAGRYG